VPAVSQTAAQSISAIEMPQSELAPSERALAQALSARPASATMAGGAGRRGLTESLPVGLSQSGCATSPAPPAAARGTRSRPCADSRAPGVAVGAEEADDDGWEAVLRSPGRTRSARPRGPDPGRPSGSLPFSPPAMSSSEPATRRHPRTRNPSRSPELVIPLSPGLPIPAFLQGLASGSPGLASGRHAARAMALSDNQ